MSEIKKITLDSNTEISKSSTAQHSTAQIIMLEDLYGENGYGSAGGRIYDVNGIAPSMGASHFAQIKFIVEVKRLE